LTKIGNVQWSVTLTPENPRQTNIFGFGQLRRYFPKISEESTPGGAHKSNLRAETLTQPDPAEE